ncbi:hypothetical protein [Bacillus phage BSTP8]|nr:repressor protein cI [Bacillus phage BSTP5]QRI44352.1 hypothetical protein [Bacillus phage BSTP8]QRI44415.1 hypothetical protein [Bacillus phage BSTP10]QRI44545.1 hypothetical protein [Bacillus phage BSTP12]
MLTYGGDNMTWEEFLAKIQKYKDGATVTGEMETPGLSVGQAIKVDDIPLSPAVNYDQLTQDDNEPHEVVVEMPVGKSKRGWLYTEEAVKSIVKQVNEKTAAGFKGHQKAENVSTEFLDPATHWIGAKYDESAKKAYFRGYVDPKEKDLRRWIKSGRIKETSIFGQMQLKKVAGETHVVDCDLMSIDWTPLGRPGMKTQVVDVKIAGEMIEGGNENMNREELLAAIRKFLTENKVTARELAGEMDENFKQEIEAAESQLSNVAKTLGLAENATAEQIDAKLKELKALEEEKQEASKEELAQEVIKEKLPESQEAQELAGEMFVFTGETKEEIAGEMDSFLAKPAVKKLFDNLMTDSVASGRKDQRKKSDENSSLRTVRRSLY